MSDQNDLWSRSDRINLWSPQGIAFAGNFPVIGAFCSRWTYFKQVCLCLIALNLCSIDQYINEGRRLIFDLCVASFFQTGFFVSVLVAYVQLSPAITNPVSGALCTAFSWSWVVDYSDLATENDDRGLTLLSQIRLLLARCRLPRAVRHLRRLLPQLAPGEKSIFKDLQVRKGCNPDGPEISIITISIKNQELILIDFSAKILSSLDVEVGAMRTNVILKYLQKHPFVGPVETGKIAKGKPTVESVYILLSYFETMKSRKIKSSHPFHYFY